MPPTALDTLLPSKYLQQHGGRQHAANGGANGGASHHSSGTDKPSTAAAAEPEAAEWEGRYARLPGDAAEPPLQGAPGSSGGYMEFVLRVAASRLFGPGAVPSGDAPLPVRIVRNADFKEIILEPPPMSAAGSSSAAAAAGDGGEGGGGGGALNGRRARGDGAAARPPLRFAAAYGFRNIQSLVRKVKLGRCEYDYVEVMACPGGCLNGGGQLKPGAGRTAAQLLEELETLYFVQQEQRQQQQLEGGGAAASACNGGGNGSAGGCGCRGGEGPMEVDGAEGGGSVQTLKAAAAVGTQQQPSDSQPWRPVLSATARALYRDWVGGAPGSAAAHVLLHTGYHARLKTAMGMVGDW